MKQFYLQPLVLIVATLFSLNTYASPQLSSYPSAAAVIYLDFDGQTISGSIWNSGNRLVCAPAPMSDLQITEVFNRVAEDYRPFEINITTDSTVFLAAPLTLRMRVIVTPTSAWYPGVGGVSFLGSFSWGDDIPCFVFCDRLGYSAKRVAECCSHESGHTVGLAHQSKYDVSCNLTSTYNDGIGSGEVGWAPVMGNSYYKNMSGWNNGPTPYGCTAVQDNLSIIATQNGFTYRADDYSDDIKGAPLSINISPVPLTGIITTSTDKDVFKINIPYNSNFHFEVTPSNVGVNNEGADLDVKVSLFDGTKTLIADYDPADKMNVSVDTILSSGDYYLMVQGAGNSNVSDYGSLGSYRITGLQGVLPIKQVKLTGNIINSKHTLSWSILSDNPVKTISIESSETGTNFKTIITTDGNTNSFGYVPYGSSDIFYRLKVTSVQNEIAYSNTIFLKAAGNAANPFNVSTFVHNQLTVNAEGNYEYLLSDINGNVVLQGKGQRGFNYISTSKQIPGMYILQLVSNNKKQTERIIKQ